MSKIFLSKFEKPIDQRCRITCPNEFRSVIASETYNGLVLLPSYKYPTIDCFGVSIMTKLSALLEEKNAYPFFASQNENEDISAIFADANLCSFDSAGRFLLPEAFMSHAKISRGEEVLFVGQGPTFQIWNKALFEEHSQNMKRLISNKNKNKNNYDPNMLPLK